MDLSIVYFPSAVLLGALHALEPGHSKTLTAAYLIGTKGTKSDATLLGLSVAFTHSLIVVGLCLIALTIGREAFTGEASHYLSVGSSVAVILLGYWLLIKRLKALKRADTIIANSHSHAPSPVDLSGRLLNGTVSIIDTENGERFELIAKELIPRNISITIDRNGIPETHILTQKQPGLYMSTLAPAEPHEFKAVVSIEINGETEVLIFEMTEPHHHHDHALLSDEEHAKAHGADLPDYVGKGERPSPWQVIAFGAAGGLVPCPAAISVMLLSLSLNQTGRGLILVLGFGIGLALTLVGVGLLVVSGISKLAATGRFSKLSAYAPTIAACMVMLSGTIGLLASFFTIK